MLEQLQAAQQVLRAAPAQYGEWHQCLTRSVSDPGAARSCIESALQQGVVRGLLVIEDRTGQTREYGQVGEDGQRTVKLVVKDDAFWTRVYLSHGLGCTSTIILLLFLLLNFPQSPRHSWPEMLKCLA